MIPRGSSPRSATPSAMLQVASVSSAPGKVAGGINEGFLGAPTPKKPQISASLLSNLAFRLRF
eukprot:6755984-Alexandrium_andersonii.AAC.1